ncbi:MAG: S26 family signal peptidase [Halobacteriaceae archaeon]
MTDGDHEGPTAAETEVRDGPDVASDDGPPRPRDGIGPALRWLWHTDDEWVVFGRELVKSAAAVAVIGLLLFTISGVWPPMVAVESGSMEPNMHRGDLVFVVEEHRYNGGSAVAGTGVVPYQVATESGYKQFGDYGDVFVFMPPARGGSPIIHRARMWVEDGENWVQDANPNYLGGRQCGDLSTCPAPHDGFITKGDNNARYDQVQGIAPVVRPSWIRGRAMVRIPYLGHVRLLVSSLSLAKAGTGALAAGAVAATR